MHSESVAGVRSEDVVRRHEPRSFAQALDLDSWPEAEVDLGHPSLSGVEHEHVAAALLAGCGADVVVRE